MEEDVIALFKKAIRRADESGMLSEFLDAFFGDIEDEQEFKIKIGHALYEWDL